MAVPLAPRNGTRTFLTCVSGSCTVGAVSVTREFKDVRGRASAGEALPVEEFMAELEALQTRLVPTRNQLWHAVADGTLSLELVKRFCKEYYFLGKWYT